MCLGVHHIDLMHMGIPGAIGAWAVHGPDGWIVIESGPATCWEVLRSGLESLGATPDTIAALLVTHIHLDHAGGAWRFAQLGIPVHVHTKGAAHLIDPSRLERSSRRIFGDRFDTLWGALQPCEHALVHAHEDHDIVRAGGLSFQAINTPGHADHHHAWHLLEGDGEDLFCGDAAAMVVPGTNWITIPMPPPEFRLERWLESLERIEHGPWTRLRLTHGGTQVAITEHIAQLRTSMQMQVDWIADSVSQPPKERIEAYRTWLWEQAEAHGVPESLFEQHVSPGLVSMNLAGVDRWATP
ncbi:MAG: MBL fold metallo-hydrolase [Phycisphaerales bacterium]|nr:MBL fold metallo-hydrolase [Phycisphaerales bacterium]